MTQPQTEPYEAPDWSLGWRLRRALEWGGVSAKVMAGELDVSEGTISRWCHDVGAPPRSIYLRAWASKCRVPFEWLTGEGEPNGSHITALMRDPQPSTADILAMRKALGHGRRHPNARAGKVQS